MSCHVLREDGIQTSRNGARAAERRVRRYGGDAWDADKWAAEEAIKAAQAQLDELERNKEKKKPQASCINMVPRGVASPSRDAPALCVP